MTTNWRNEVEPMVYAQAQAACPIGHNGEADVAHFMQLRMNERKKK